MEIKIENLDEFFRDDSLKTVKKMNRLNLYGKRYYFDETFQFKMGITSFLSQTMKEPFFLKDWNEKNPGLMQKRAEYGTLFHIHAAEILRNWKFGIKKHQLSMILDEELKQDLIGFISWVEHSEPKAILIESQAISESMQLASTLDFFGTVKMPVKGFYGEVYKTGDKKGTAKETTIIQDVLCIIDFKTAIKHEDSESDKSISTYNKLQLNYQRLFIREMFPEYKNTEIKLYNVITKNWQTIPDMQVSEVQSISDEILKAYYFSCREIYPELFDIADKKLINFKSDYEGSISECYEIQTVKEYCMKNYF